ncbi:DUF1028 domain-containing protein [Micromonospora sp. MH99]|uniref:DUF1028 domain-containing protein n=1 Tax=Micromonospora sp. MH99 TaxID=1945510 RepID=UPI001F2A5042|nr:DUF1028 domain-containing protein [Micromonospora sp. MH99]MCF0095623.1 hypothetical protein [Micromonospora sp. MH99]
MTFSLVARSADGRRHGVVVASKFLAAGALVPAAQAEVGALATQAHVNLAYRPQGLTLLRTGVGAADVVAGLVAADAEREHRQLGVVGVSGPGASWTGPACHPWAGGRTGDGWAAQGNILTGPEVVDALGDTWLASSALPFAERLDDHPDPVTELGRLLAVHTLLFSRPDPATLLDLSGAVADEVATLLTALGHPVGDDGPEAALFSWAGLENLEERLVPGRIDPVVLTHLRGVAPHVPAPRPAS